MTTLIENTDRAISAFDRMVANIEAKGVSVPADMTVEEQVDKILEISGDGGVPVIPAPEGDFYAAIAYFTGDIDGNFAYAYANDSAEFSAQFCQTSGSSPNHFAGVALHGTPGGSDSIFIPIGKVFGFYFGNQFNLTGLPANTLRRFRKLNQPIAIPEMVTSLGSYFMEHCYDLNAEVVLPNTLSSLPQSFMGDCHKFDKPIDFKNITTFGRSVISNCYNFNQPLDLSKITKFGHTFAHNWHRYEHTLEFHEGTTSIETGPFIYNCFLIKHVIANCAATPSGANALSTTDPNAPCYVDGIMISGKYAQEWIDALPNSDVSPYRKLILAEKE